MNEKIYYSAEDIAKMLGVSMGKAYKILREMNKDLASKGFLTIAGKIPVEYFKEKWYGGAVELATISFGQSFQITPIKLLTTAASIVNGGNLVTGIP